MKSRREFLATMGAFGAASIFAGSPRASRAVAAEGGEKLAINGGAPVRKSPLGTGPFGPQFYDDVEKQELIEVLESRSPFRWHGPSSKALQFEKAYAKHIGVKYAIGVTSGTTALYTAMAALEIGPGDEVILPAWTWYADYDAVVLCGALPVFVEIDESLAMDPTQIEAKITPRTKAIVPSHLQGGLADMDAILEIARKHNLRVVEDCAQCCGGRHKGKFVGSIGDLPGLKMRKSPDIDGDLGSVIFFDWGTRERRDRFLRAMRAEGISAAGPGGSAILPADARIAKKATIHPDWPSFNTPQGKAIQYGAESCPRTIDIIGRFGGVMMGPRYDDDDVKDIIQAIRKVYLVLGTA